MRFILIVSLLTMRATAADPLNRDTPQTSVFAFLQAWHTKDYLRAARYLDLRKLEANQRTKQGVQLAAELGQILESDTHFDEAALSRDSDAPSPELVASFHSGSETLQLEIV